MQETMSQAAQDVDIRTTLDRMFPGAQHGEVVDYQGKQYRRRYYPEQLGRSGWAVKKWGRTWEEVPRK